MNTLTEHPGLKPGVFHDGTFIAFTAINFYTINNPINRSPPPGEFYLYQL